MTAGSTGEAALPGERRKQLAQLLREKARQSRAAFPASAAQRGVWFMQQMEPNTHAYHLACCLRVSSPIAPDRMKSALVDLIDRNSMLRTTFRGEDHKVEMIVQGAADPEFVTIAATGWSDAELQKAARQVLLEPFDLVNGPLLRLHLFSRGEADHVFLLVVHHLACDGASLRQLLAELMECYQSGGPQRLPPRGMEMPEFIRRQQERLAGAEGEKSKAYWLDRLAGEIPRLNLPASRPSQESSAIRSEFHFFEIEEVLCRRIMALARTCGVTPFSLLLSAYQTLLMRLCGQEDIVVGVPMGGRLHPESEGIIGHLVNLVPIRGDLSGDPSFRKLIARTLRNIHGAIEHQEFPYQELVRLVRPNGRFERYPLFRTCFNMLKILPADPLVCNLWKGSGCVQWGPLQVASFPLEPLDEQYDLSLRVVELEGRLQVKVQYDSSLYDAELIEHYCRCLVELLRSCTSNPDLPLSKLTILPANDRERMLNVWNETAADYPRDTTVHKLIAEQAARTPDAIAVVFEGERLSYRELNGRANQLAGYLRSRGIGRNDLVAVCAERSLELVIGLLATLKSGAAYVPVDPRYPAGRIELMIHDSGAGMVLTTGGCDESIGGVTAVPRFCMDRDWHLLEGITADELPVTGQPLDLAYVIYTSGSTGTPRGVEIQHRALVNFLYSMRDRPGIAPGDVLLSVTTLSFDIFGLELFLPLMVGARVELANGEEIVDGALLATRLAASGATIMQATPVTWRILLGAGYRGAIKALCGGEALAADLAEQMLAAGMELWNMYGPTETTIWSCVERIRDVAEGGAISIGRPIANTQAYVVDSHLQPVPLGVVGELFLGGEGLARGYRGRPDITAAKFIANPFSSAAGERIYRTGDLACYLADGRLECIGRTDQQVKVRGFRIEIEEIEIGIRQQPGVSAAAVACHKEAEGGPRLIAFVTGDFPDGLSSGDIREGLRRILPEYMIPSQFLLLPALPLTPNGKIDRKSLPIPAAGEVASAGYVEPKDELERQLASIFAEVLKVPRVGATDSFFDLGGDSISAVSLAARIKEKFERSILFAALFHSPTVAGLAELIRDKSSRCDLSLMTLRQSGSKPPLFYLPGAVGTGLPFQKVIGNYPFNRRVYACSIPEAQEDPSTQASIHTYALDMLERIREVCPSGPFHLLGYSFGGYIAFEIGHILAERGEPISFLGMIDTWGPGFPSKNPFGRRAMLHIKKIRNLPPRQRIAYFQTRAAKVAARARRRLRPSLAPAPAPQPAAVAANPQQAINGMLDVAAAAIFKYEPKPLKSRLWFYRADIPIDDGPGLSFEDPYNGWRNFITEEFHITRLACAHDKIFEEPAVTQLASALISHLDKADPA